MPYLRDLESMVPSEKPPVTEIANMPFPLSMLAMRKHYHKDWHKPEPDGETAGKWAVEIDYTYRTEDVWDCSVEAVTEDEAKEMAKAKFDEAHRWNDAEIEEIRVEFVETEQ